MIRNLVRFVQLATVAALPLVVAAGDVLAASGEELLATIRKNLTCSRTDKSREDAPYRHIYHTDVFKYSFDSDADNFTIRTELYATMYNSSKRQTYKWQRYSRYQTIPWREITASVGGSENLDLSCSSGNECIRQQHIERDEDNEASIESDETEMRSWMWFHACKPAQVAVLVKAFEEYLPLKRARPLEGAEVAAVCGSALDSDRYDWNTLPAGKDAVAEARLRTLATGDCRVALGLPRSAVLPGIVHRADALLVQADAFGKSGIPVETAVRLAPLMQALKAGLSAADQPKVEQGLAALDAALAADVQYAAFLKAEAEARATAAAKALAEAEARLRLAGEFAARYVSGNMLAGATAKLLPLIGDVDAVRTSGDADRITTRLAALETVFRESSLTPDFEKHVSGACGTSGVAGCVAVAAAPASEPVKPAAPAPAIVEKQKRVALVIGNGAYAHVANLPNPPNDSADVAAAFERVGFVVHKAADLGRNAFRDTLAEFSNEALGADIAVVFYAGHGMEVDKQNYLIPVDAKLETDLRVRFETVPLDDVLAALEGVRGLRVVILDACRNNPFLTTMKVTTPKRAVGRGFDRVEPAVGTLVSYAAKEGTTASDGDGRNSPFTAALLANLRTPGVEINKLFRLVRDDVLAASNGQQEPYTYGSTSGRDEFFNPPAPVAAAQ